MSLSADLTTQEKLLLSQAIYKLGAFSWPQVSDLLLVHPSIKPRPKELFTPDRCEAMYKEMMGVIGINVPTPDGMKPHTKSHLRLAQTHYIARMSELHAQIAAHESRFTALVTEVTSLKSGDLDDALKREIVEGLEKKFGKKIMDGWLEGEGKGQILKAVEAGEVKAGEVDPEEEKKRKEKEAEKAKVAAAKAKEAEEAAKAQAEAEAAEEAEKAKAAEQAAKEEAAKAEAAKAAEAVQDASEDVEMKEATLETPPKDATPEKEAVKTPEPTEDISPAQSPLSPAPSDLSPIKPEPAPKRSHKRKAASQPRGAPAGKRSGRRGAAAAAEAEESEGEEEEHSDEEGDNEEEQPATRGRQGKRSSPAKPSLSPTKEGSPANSRRAPSVSSTNSATPGEERRSTRRGAASRRGKREVSKPVRDQTVEREEEDNTSVAGEDHEEPRKATRASRRKSGAVEAATPTPSATERRGTRSTAVVPPRLGHREVAASELSVAGGQDEVAVKEEAAGFSTTLAPRVAKRSSKPFLMALFEIILSHKFSNVFETPVRKSEAADYYDVIKKPMDLKTVKAGIKNGRIGSIDELERDVLLIFSNAMMYNAPDSQVYGMAKDMMKDCEGHFVHYRNMEMEMGGDGA
ncbi:hypothetical protein L198_02017 [Cryptococcus wingfieldii CBS 7118]|uniref:Bromo domain-containing protein n=1 Tax=Cryptococcus wingfieldii CBS 7118 TaxID=1295528 RepID=A0A1E3JWT5_9TREE|nr:hypothetical protein L198_02017 [Cryptococcus wingfieldii CBS 7118]ODO05324.1 hypothetical protein L198_02017 [Cryptococcus wingfieldii CBS 7118]